MKGTPTPDVLNCNGEGYYLGTRNRFIFLWAQKSSHIFRKQLVYKTASPKLLQMGPKGLLELSLGQEEWRITWFTLPPHRLESAEESRV